MYLTVSRRSHLIRRFVTRTGFDTSLSLLYSPEICREVNVTCLELPSVVWKKIVSQSLHKNHVSAMTLSKLALGEKLSYDLSYCYHLFLTRIA